MNDLVTCDTPVETVDVIHKECTMGFTNVTAVAMGQSLYDIADKWGYHDSGSAFVRKNADSDWKKVERSEWVSTYPTPTGGEPNFMFTYFVQGGSKNIFRIIAAIVVAVVAPYLAGVAFGVGTTAALIGTAVLTIAGNYVIGQVFPPETISNGPKEGQEANTYARVGSDSNVLGKHAYLPVPMGTREFSPPELTSPRFRVVNGRQVVERIFGIHGETEITDIKVDKSPVENFPLIETEILDGGENTTTYSTLVTKSNSHIDISEELAGFKVTENPSSTDGSPIRTLLLDQDVPLNSAPIPVRFTLEGGTNLEEMSFRWVISNFLKNDAPTKDIILPARVRIKPKGDEWKNLPEIWIEGQSNQTELIEVRMRWASDFGEIEFGGKLTNTYWASVPEVTAYTLSDGSTGPQWESDPHFSTGSGPTGVKNISTRKGVVLVQLDESIFPKDKEYEIEVTRGLSVLKSSISQTAYTIGGVVKPLFLSISSGEGWITAVDSSTYVATLSISHGNSIFNTHPCHEPGTAILALLSRGQTVKNISLLGKGITDDWNGSEWVTRTTSDNPAVWFRRALIDWLATYDIDTDLIDNDSIVAWRQECIDRGYKISALPAGDRIGDVLSMCCSAGYAKPSFENGFGVTYFRDRSSEMPVSIISPRNTSSISMVKSDIEIPLTKRVTFINEDKSYSQDEMTIPSPVPTNFSGHESGEIKGMTNFDQIYMRETFDYLQKFHRPITWVCDMFIEHIGFSIGDLVGVTNDIVNAGPIGARITKVIDPYTIVIDNPVTSSDGVNFYDIPNLFDEDNIFDTGEDYVAFFTNDTGAEMKGVAYAGGRVIRLNEKLSDTDICGSHVAIGPRRTFTNRCLVIDIIPDENKNATVILVDEAPEIWETMKQMFPLVFN